MTTEELFEQMEEQPERYEATVGEDVIRIDADTRKINLPESMKLFGVESDEKAERKQFVCPRMVGDNIDLSSLNLYINFRNAGGEADLYLIDDVEEDGEDIRFSWKLSRRVTKYKTDQNRKLSFILCAKKGMNTENEWNTTVCSEGVVLEGLEAGGQIAEENPDIIQYILEKLEYACNLTPEQIGAEPEGMAETEVNLHNSSESAHPDIRRLIDDIHAPGTRRIEMTAQDTVVELEAGDHYYVFPEMNSLKYTLKGDGEVHFFFKSGATPTNLIHPVGVNVGNLYLVANKLYEVSILNGVLLWECR